MSSWFWDDCEGMSDIQKEQLAALLDGKDPDLMNEIRETAEKFDRDIRESRGESVESNATTKSYWFAPDDDSDRGLIYFSERKIPFLYEFEKPNNYMRNSRKKSFKNDVAAGTTPLPSGIIIEEKIDGLSNENNTAQPTKKTDGLSNENDTAQPTKKTDEITEEQNKKFTKIPWILMRANSLKRWCYWLVGAAANAGLTKFIETARAPYNPNDPVQLIVPLSWCVIVFWALANSYFDCQQYFEVDNIRKKMLKYKENMDDSLSFDDIGGYGINRGAIVRYLSKKNPEIFDRMITTPASVKDDKITENIMLGHVRACPTDAQRAFDTFGKSLSAKVHRRIQRYNARQR